MCLYIVDSVSTCRIIYFRYVVTEKHIDNSPTSKGHFKWYEMINFKRSYNKIIKFNQNNFELFVIIKNLKQLI